MTNIEVDRPKLDGINLPQANNTFFTIRDKVGFERNVATNVIRTRNVEIRNVPELDAEPAFVLNWYVEMF